MSLFFKQLCMVLDLFINEAEYVLVVRPPMTGIRIAFRY